jgi:hypothetical protein
VAWALDALHGTEGRYAHLDGVAGVSLGKDLKQVTHGRRQLGLR